MSTPFPPPYQGPASPATGQAMTDVIIAPSTNTTAPWRYLISYAYPNDGIRFRSNVIERAEPVDTETRINEACGALHVPSKVAVLSLILMAGPEPIVHRVPVITGPTADTNPYRYLLAFYGSSRDGRDCGFGTFSPDFDVPLTGPESLDILTRRCAARDGYDPDKTYILNYALLAGPAL